MFKFSEFDIPDNLSKVVLIAILSVYVAISFNELFTEECSGIGNCFDYDRRMARLENWNFGWIESDFRHLIHMGLLELSYGLFENYKVLSFVSSILLLVIAYAFASNLTGKNIAGLIAVLVVLQSSVFYKYDTSVVYPSFWALLFLTSLYLITTKGWFLNSIPYLFSIPAKALTVLFIPATIGFMWFYNKKVLKIFIPVMSIPIVLALIKFEPKTGGFFLIDHFNLMDFLGGFVSWMWQGFAGDQSTLLLLIVFSFLLFFNRKVIPNSNALLALVVGIILTSPILTGMTTYSIWPYRMVPLVVLVGIVVGMVVTNLDRINLKMFMLSKS